MGALINLVGQMSELLPSTVSFDLIPNEHSLPHFKFGNWKPQFQSRVKDMASSAQLRLMSDLKSIRNDPSEGFSASPLSDDNLFVWSATIFGPDETPWEVYNEGSLCMDIIQDAWSPCHNVCTILTSIQSLLTDPNPASPANPEAAHMFQHDILNYNRRVRQCARRSIES